MTGMLLRPARVGTPRRTKTAAAPAKTAATATAAAPLSRATRRPPPSLPRPPSPPLSITQASRHGHRGVVGGLAVAPQPPRTGGGSSRGLTAAATAGMSAGDCAVSAAAAAIVLEVELEVTEDKAKSCTLIDIPLSNCLNGTINKIFVLTQYNSQSLNRYITRTYGLGGGVPLGGDGFVEHFRLSEEEAAAVGAPYIASTGMYVFNKKLLLKLLQDNPRAHSFGADVLPLVLPAAAELSRENERRLEAKRLRPELACTLLPDKVGVGLRVYGVLWG
ncbi:Glucose-1-phosphate adenylyltransferase large subunit, chloroplastic/amyloplastic [Tetrabaena socialis]|uniref:glucose-1-phosphate adenylyltransferase n=1 Tax=Tetrabaena socialis TaxID=47790 RepID=A0A2J7ZXX8_9CHLO|nr:Glucose-1-phosphate adenylyltransferase large subunit, chloroplastic/amyloplastic [Tetrabaena socialis]|eukprot:PNH05117.1 Glucose-1-phosphate adenylyltransferase large subunit, chloroplastic/amyloplastic [Tetrabaena socialis]